MKIDDEYLDKIETAICVRMDSLSIECQSKKSSNCIECMISVANQIIERNRKYLERNDYEKE